MFISLEFRQFNPESFFNCKFFLSTLHLNKAREQMLKISSGEFFLFYHIASKTGSDYRQYNSSPKSSHMCSFLTVSPAAWRCTTAKRSSHWSHTHALPTSIQENEYTLQCLLYSRLLFFLICTEFPFLIFTLSFPQTFDCFSPLVLRFPGDISFPYHSFRAVHPSSQYLYQLTQFLHHTHHLLTKDRLF